MAYNVKKEKSSTSLTSGEARISIWVDRETNTALKNILFLEKKYCLNHYYKFDAGKLEKEILERLKRSSGEKPPGITVNRDGELKYYPKEGLSDSESFLPERFKMVIFDILDEKRERL